MAIQNRRGVYTDYDPSRLVEGEWAVVKSGDPNSSNGRSVYMCFEAGTVKRMATYEDMEADINAATADIQQTLTADVAETISDANAAVQTMQTDINGTISDANAAVQTMQGTVSSAILGINASMRSFENTFATLANNNADQLQNMQTQVATSLQTAQTEIDSAIADAEEATANANAVSEQIQEIIAQGGVVISVFGRAGEVVAASGDYSADQITYGNSNVADALVALGTYDTTPISGSPRPVTSGGVYTSFYTRLGILSFSKDSNNRIVVTYDA